MSSLEPARRSLATAARALDEFRRLSGAEAESGAPPALGWSAPAEAGARAALDEARARLAALEAELTATREASEAESAASKKEFEAELTAVREAFQSADARAHRAETDARDAAAAWTARLELLEREALSAARAEAARELAETKARAASLEADLEAARGTAAALEAEARDLRAAAINRAASRDDSRSNADSAQRRAAEAASRVTLLEAECVRLQSMRRSAEQAAADVEAQGRAVAEALRGELRVVHAALDRAAVEAGAAEGRTRAEVEPLLKRLEASTARVQALEREKRLEAARGTGDSSAVHTELLRAQAVAASLRQELTGARTEAEALRRQAAEARAALERTVADRPVELERALTAARDAQAQIDLSQTERLRAQAAAAALRQELADAQAALERTVADRPAELERALAAARDARAEVAALRQELSGARALAAREKEALRRQVVEAQATFERTLAEKTAESGAKELVEALLKKLAAATARVQALESEKRLEREHGAAEASIQMELDKAQKTAAALRQELSGARAEEDALRRQAAEAQEVAAALRRDAFEARSTAAREQDGLRRHAAEVQAALERMLAERTAELERVSAAAQAAKYRAAVEAGAAEVKIRAQVEPILKRLEAAMARVQALEREKLFEQEQGAGATSAIEMELVRARAASASLSQELSGVRAEQDALHRRAAETRAALERAVAERTAELERASSSAQDAQAQLSTLRTQLLKAQSAAASLRQELAAPRAEEDALRRRTAEMQDAQAQLFSAQTELQRMQEVAASLRQELLGTRVEEDALRRRTAEAQTELDRRTAEAKSEFDRRSAETQAEFERRTAETQAALDRAVAKRAEEEPEPLTEAGPSAEEAVAAEPFVSPALEPVLEPGWARLLRLVRPPVDSAYAHLRRLSTTALTTGQKALLRMAAASIASASDSLSSIELALEDGPAPGAASSVLPILESSLAAWESAFRGRGVALAREFSSSLPETAHDPKELRIALHHVLRNVLEAVPRGGRLSLRAWRGTDGGLRLEFTDDGPGFSKEWLARRFEPFAAPRRGRAGLGLSLVRRTLRRWGGDVEASNGPSGRGARVTLIFASPPPPVPPPASAPVAK